MPQDQPNPSHEDLIKENEQLREKVKSYEQANKRAWKTKFFVAEKVGVFFLLGPKLKESLVKVMEGDFSKDNIADLLIAVLYRFTRIGLFAILVAMVPIGILTIQTILLNRQNGKIDRQNILLNQQTALLEADRRSSLVHLFNNVLDQVDKELKDSKNVKRELTPQTIGRVVALSGALKPYRYLEDSTLTEKKWSPERAQLLISLYGAKLDSNTMIEICKRGDFSYAKFPYRTVFEGASFYGIKLRGAYLRGVDFRDAKLRRANFYGANLSRAYLEGANLQIANLEKANLSSAFFRGANLHAANFNSAYIIGADFSETKFIATKTWRFAIPAK